MFDSAKLMGGDILLSRHRGLRSSAIRWVTRSKYSHAAIAGNSFLFVEAVGTGVRGFQINEVVVRNPSNVRVLRIDDNVADAVNIRKNAAVQAATFSHSEYWTTGALTSVFPELPMSHGSRYFCSHLVSLCFPSGLHSSQAKGASKILPDDFLFWPVTDVTNDVLREQQSIRGSGLVFYDSSSAPVAMDPFVSIMQSVYYRTRDMYLSYGLPDPGGFQQAIAALIDIEDRSLAAALDKAIMAALSDSDFLGMYSQNFSSGIEVVLRYMRQVKEVLELPASSNMASRLRRRAIANLLARIKHDYSVVSDGFPDLLASSEVLSMGSKLTGLGTFRYVSQLQRNDHALFEYTRAALGQLIRVLEAALRNEQNLAEIIQNAWNELHAATDRLHEYAKDLVLAEASGAEFPTF